MRAEITVTSDVSASCNCEAIRGRKIEIAYTGLSGSGVGSPPIRSWVHKEPQPSVVGSVADGHRYNQVGPQRRAGFFAAAYVVLEDL